MTSITFINRYNINSYETFIKFCKLSPNARIIELHIDEKCSGIELSNIFISGDNKLSLLEELYIRNCKCESLPASVCNLTHLRVFCMFECRILTGLLATFGNLQTLTSIAIYNCDSLTSLPASFCCLQNLRDLKISGCVILKSLPEDFGRLSNLMFLDIFYCYLLSDLSDSFGDLKQLIKLNIKSCESLKSLPDSFGGLQSLVSLYINCCGITVFPKSCGGLQQITDITIRNCSDLESVQIIDGSLQSLNYLAISDCGSLPKLPDSIGLCFKLKTVYISNVDVDVDVDLLPPSIILIPQIQVSVNNTLAEMQSCRAKWIQTIARSREPFYTKPIAELFAWSRDNHKTLDPELQNTIIHLILGIQRRQNHESTHGPRSDAVSFFDTEMLEEAFTVGELELEPRCSNVLLPKKHLSIKDIYQ